MQLQTDRLRTPSIHTRTVLFGASFFALSTGLAQFLTETPAWRFDSPVQYDSDFAVAVGLCWTLFQLVLHRPPTR